MNNEVETSEWDKYGKAFDAFADKLEKHGIDPLELVELMDLFEQRFKR